MNVFEIKGLKVLHKRTSNKICSARVVVNAGSEKESHLGVAHFLEHMAFKGTKYRDTHEFKAATAKVGDVNAGTDYQYTTFYQSFLNSDFAAAMRLLMELVFEPLLPADVIPQEIGVITEECQMYIDQPQNYFFDNLTADLYGHGFHDRIGTKESIAATTREHLEQFRNEHYRLGDMAVAVIGDVAHEDVWDVIAGLFDGKLARAEQQPHPKPTVNLQDAKFFHDSEQAMLHLAAATGISLRQEVELNYLPDVFGNALGGGMHSLLFRRIRDDLGLCYAINAWHRAFNATGTQDVFVRLDAANIEQARQVIDEVIATVKHDGVSADLLDTAKRNVIFREGRTLESASGIGGKVDHCFFFGDAISEAVDFDAYRRRIEAISNNDVIEYARKVYSDDAPIKTTTMTKA